MASHPVTMVTLTERPGRVACSVKFCVPQANDFRKNECNKLQEAATNNCPWKLCFGSRILINFTLQKLCDKTIVFVYS